MERLPDDASESDIHGLLLSDHSSVRAKFVARFPQEIKEVSTSLSQSYSAYRRLEARVRLDKRAAYVQAYVYSAFNSLLTSSNLLLSGLQLPSGNLMRHYGESTAMALLCSHPQINTFELLEKNEDTFPFSTSLELVARERNRKLLDLKGPEWRTFREISKFYDRFSHASWFAIASQFVFSQPGMLAVLGEFDEDKVSAYEVELRRRNSGARVLRAMVDHLAERLPPREPPVDPTIQSAAT